MYNTKKDNIAIAHYTRELFKFITLNNLLSARITELIEKAEVKGNESKSLLPNHSVHVFCKHYSYDESFYSYKPYK